MARPNELDMDQLAQMAAGRTSRRQFLSRGAIAAGVAAFGPAFLAACGKSSSNSSSTTTAGSTGGTTGPATGTLRISNWPLYMADGFVDQFQTASGLSVDYKEDFNDNEEWFAKVKDPLSHKQDIGADLAVPTEFMAGRLMGLGWLNTINAANVPNKSNMRPDLANSTLDPGRQYTMPYMSGMVGLAYNKSATGRPITSVDDLWDPAFKGQVSLFSDMRDGLGMVMLSQGDDPSSPTTETVQKAADKVGQEKESGQIRRFTGNDYADDLASGNVVIAQAYSGDVVQLQADNPDLEFIVPSAGGTTFVDTMVIPYTTKNQAAAEAWMNYVYDPANYAQLIVFVQYVPVLANMGGPLEALDPDVAANPLINPPQSTLDNLHSWPSLTDEQEQEYATIYAGITGE